MMIKKKKCCFFLLVILILFSGLNISPLTIHPASGYMWDVIEDFMTTKFKDTEQTTIYGWQNNSGVISLPRTFPRIGSESVGTIPSSVTVKFPYVYVPVLSEGLQIFNIENPSNPQNLGALPMNYCIDAVVKGDYLYTVDYDVQSMEVVPSFFTIFNLTRNPVNPIKLGSVTRPSNSTYFFLLNGITLAGNWVYVIEYNWNLAIFNLDSYTITSINITNPLNPLFGSSIVIPLTPDPEFQVTFQNRMFIHGNYLYFPNAYDGFHIINITDPFNMNLVYTNNEGCQLVTVSVDQDMAYFMDLDSKIHIFDVSIPVLPINVSTYLTPKKLKAIFVEDGWVYIAHSRVGYPGGFQAIDFQDPLTPIVVDSVSLGTEFYFITKDQDYIYLVGSTLEILAAKAYVSTAVAQSKTVVATQGTAFFQMVDFSGSIFNIPTNTSIQMYFSSDAGLHWELASMGTGHEFIYQGTELRWKAVFTSTNGESTPSISFLIITSYITIATPVLLSPQDVYYTLDNTPHFTWEDLPDANGYLIQLDQVSTFNSPNCRDYAISSAEYTLEEVLSAGTWYWRVVALDLMDEPGVFSSFRSIIIDNITHPDDVSYLMGTYGNTITWEARAYYAEWFQVFRDGISVTSTLWEGDPVTISIDGLPAGLHNYTCTFYDVFGNTVSDSVTVNVSDVQDFTKPSIIHPEDFSYVLGSVGHTITWQVADDFPSGFQVERNGSLILGGPWFGENIQILVDDLPQGIHLYTCTVYDQASNINNDSVIVTVYLPIEEPQMNHPEDIIYEEGSWGHILTWNPVDTDPDSFKVTGNGIFLFGGPWWGEAIAISIDGLVLGTYDYICTVYDKQGNLASDLVTVTVRDTTPPSIDHPADVIYIEGISATHITWHPLDRNPASYSISLNGTTFMDGSWDGGMIMVDVSGLTPGNYSLVCTVFDTSGNSNFDLIEVVIPLITSRSASYPPLLVPFISLCMIFVFQEFKKKKEEKIKPSLLIEEEFSN